ncbi:MAG: ComEC/Rec2 family competence protein [Bacteroidota bacterium]
MLSHSLPAVWRCKFLFVYFLVSFAAGIVTAYYVDCLVLYQVGWVAFLGLVVGYLVLAIWLYDKSALGRYNGVIGLACVFLAGYLSVVERKPMYDAYDVMHCVKGIEAYEAVLTTLPEATKKRLKVTISLRKARIKGVWVPCNGRVKLHWPKGQQMRLGYGDVILVYGTPKGVTPWVGEEMFDYQRVLAYQNTNYTHFVDQGTFKVIGYAPSSVWRAKAFKMRAWLATHLGKNIKGQVARGVVWALLLGLRTELGADVQRVYAEAGIIHVLALSGLHVGLLYMLILLLLFFFGIKKREVRSVWVVTLLWSYACITGFSVSVLRAVSMFSLLSMGECLGRKSYRVNMLAIAAFLHLVYDPFVLFQIGFQLSYTAVLGIFLLHPNWYKWVVFSSVWKQKIGQFISISVATQLATLPLTLYYFHAFPSYFLLTNLLTIPFLPILITVACLTLILSKWYFLSSIFAKLTTQLILLHYHLMHSIVTHFPLASVKHIYLSYTTLWLGYGILISLWIFLHRRKFRYLLVSTFFAVSMAMPSLYHLVKPKNAFIFYSHPHASTLAFVDGKRATVIVNGKKQLPHYHGVVLPDLKKRGVKQLIMPSYTCMREVDGLVCISLNGKKGIWVNASTSGVHLFAQPFKMDFLWVENNAITDLAHWPSHALIKLLIIGASNDSKIRKKLQAQAITHQMAYVVLSAHTGYVASL